jgi:hypothetical protein
MPHRHLTLERYELALEEDASSAARMRQQTAVCEVCAAALAQGLLAPLLAAWLAPASIERPVAWQTALRRAIAPASQPRRRGWLHPARLVAAAGLAMALALATALPAAATADAGSALFPLRGLEEDARWQVTPATDRAALEASFTSSYLWEARTSAARHDGEGYDASMQRFFTWAGRLKADLGKAPPAQRVTAGRSIGADRALVSSLAAGGLDPAQARRAQAVLDDLEVESGEGDGQHGAGYGQAPEAQGQQSGGQGAPPSRAATPPPDDSPGSFREEGGRGRSGGS